MISAVPRPSAVVRMIRACLTCFCGLLRLSMIASSRLRSAGFRWTVVPVRIPKICTSEIRNPTQDSYVSVNPQFTDAFVGRAAEQSKLFVRPTLFNLAPSL